MENISYKYLNFIPFTNFDLWDVKRYTRKSISSKYEVIPLSKCIREQQKKYKLDEEEREYGILGVNNQEGIFDAYLQKGKEINQPYKKMEEGWIAYNPYRINVGSIGIKLKEHLYEYISPAYVVFSCLDNILPKYLFLLFKSETFNKVIRESTTGSVRQNLTIESLKNIKIPLPSLAEQEAIVNAYENKIQQAEQLEKQAEQLEIEIENYLFSELGIEKPTPKKEKIKGLQFVQFKDIERWGVDKIINNEEFKSKYYDIFTIESVPDLVLEVFRGRSPKYENNTNKYILNQKCNRWNFIDLSFSKSVNEEWYNDINEIFFTQEGDILVNSTGEGTIGRATYIDNNHTNLIYDSHILLLRLNKHLYNPALFVELFNSTYGQFQIEIMKSAQATKQTELGVNNLKKVMMPIIPNIEKQQEIVDYISALKVQIKEKKNIAEQLKHQAQTDFENQIFN